MTVSDVRIEIACHGTDLLERSASCSVRSHARVVATGYVTLAVSEGGGGSATLDGTPLTEDRVLGLGEPHVLAIDATRELSVTRELDESGGPVVALGQRAAIDFDTDGRFLLRLAYERVDFHARVSAQRVGCAA